MSDAGKRGTSSAGQKPAEAGAERRKEDRRERAGRGAAGKTRPSGVDVPMESAARDLIRGLATGLDLERVDTELENIERLSAATMVHCEVVSAVPLEADQRRAVEKGLHARHGRDLDVRYRVEPAILGGLVVRVADEYVDGSVAARLARLRQALVGTSQGASGGARRKAS